MTGKENVAESEWNPETDPVLARLRASGAHGPEWDEFIRVLEEARRQAHGTVPVPLNDPDNPPTLAKAAGAFADDPGWDRFQEAIQQYRDEQTRAELARMRQKK
jgi:hypothetical protein